MTEPKCTEVTVSCSVGGKVQIVRFEYTADFHYSMSRKYAVPENWDETEVNVFQINKTADLRAELEQVAQAEMDDLISQRDG